jgi:hypothetical protein
LLLSSPPHSQLHPQDSPATPAKGSKPNFDNTFQISNQMKIEGARGALELTNAIGVGGRKIRDGKEIHAAAPLYLTLMHYHSKIYGFSQWFRRASMEIKMGGNVQELRPVAENLWGRSWQTFF